MVMLRLKKKKLKVAVCASLITVSNLCLFRMQCVVTCDIIPEHTQTKARWGFPVTDSGSVQQNCYWTQSLTKVSPPAAWYIFLFDFLRIVSLPQPKKKSAGLLASLSAWEVWEKKKRSSWAVHRHPKIRARLRPQRKVPLRRTTMEIQRDAEKLMWKMWWCELTWAVPRLLAEILHWNTKSNLHINLQTPVSGHFKACAPTLRLTLKA